MYGHAVVRFLLTPFFGWPSSRLGRLLVRWPLVILEECSLLVFGNNACVDHFPIEAEILNWSMPSM